MKGNAWTVRSSRYALDDRWIRVRVDDCTTPCGVDVSPYFVLEFPDFVHILAFDEHDRIVLVRQYRHAYGSLSLELPGGIAECSDTSVLETAKRELREETGYVGSHYAHVTTLSVDPGRYANRLHLVGVRGVKIGEPNPEASENIEIVLVSRPEAMHIATSGGIISAPHVGLLITGLALEQTW